MSRKNETLPSVSGVKQVDTLDGLLYVRQVYPKGPPLSVFVIYSSDGVMEVGSNGVPTCDTRIERYALVSALSPELRLRIREEITALVEKTKEEK